MPRCLDPSYRPRIVLDFDKDKPRESQPAFIFRAFSLREWKDARAKASGEMDRLELAEALVPAAIVSWENMIDPETNQPIPFDVKDLDRVAGPAEIVELFGKLLDETTLSAEDKKKLESPATSSVASSAAPVAPASASAAPA